MKNRQEIKQNSYSAVTNCIDENASTATLIPGLVNANTALKNFVAQISVRRQLQEVDKKGVTINKKHLRDDVVAKAMDIALKTSSFAVLSNNDELLEEVNFTETELGKSKDNVLRDFCLIIHARATTYLSFLTPYVTQVQLDAFSAAITAFESAIPEPRNERAIKKDATKELDELFHQADAHLEKMDIMVKAAKNAFPSFYNIYMNNRILVDTGTRFISLKCSVTEMVRGKAVSGVLCIFTPSDPEGREFVKRTAQKGNFFIKHMPGGTYSCAISKAGYKSQIVPVYLTDGEMTEMEVVIEKL